MKILAILIASIVIVGMIGFASAQYSSEISVGVKENKTSDSENNSNNASRGIGQELSTEIHARQEQIKEGDYNVSVGQFLNVKELSEDLRELRSDSVTVKTELNITSEKDDKNETHLKAHLSNRNEFEIKIMPDTASKTALARLRLKVCSEANNCTIVLKEVGKNNETSANYEIKADQKVKVLGLFNAKAHIEAQVNSNTGAIISSKVPWWVSISTKV